MGRPPLGPARASAETLAAALVAAVVLAGCTTTTAPPTTAPTTTSSDAGNPASMTRTAPDGRPFVVTDVARFSEPWALAFLPGTPWLAITERSGRLHLRDTSTGATVEVSGVPPIVDAGQGGLGDIVPGPTFASDKVVYLSWVEAGAGGTGAAVGHATLTTEAATARLDDLQVIWRQTPKTSGSGHFGHRLAFSPDGAYLFVTSGERQKMDPAQDLANTLGTVVRLTPGGRPAPGNPFAGRSAITDEIWTYGHRNPLGLAFDASGNLWSTEMGPEGGDELNLIRPGANYGWPRASNGSHYGGAPIPDHAGGDGFEAPKASWTPSVSPGSLLIYSGELFPAWRGDAFIGALSGQALLRVDLDGTSAAKADSWAMGQRIREVEQAPDGSIWLLEDTPGGRLLRLTPPA